MKLKHFCFFLLSIGLIACLFGCNKDDESSIDNREQIVELDKTVVQAKLDDVVTINARFAQGVSPSRSYAWEISNPNGVVEIQENKSNSISLKVLKDGEAEIRYTSDDKTIYATCRIIVYSDVIEEGGITEIPVRVAFGPNQDVEGWNCFIGDAQSAAGSSILDLMDIEGTSTGVSATITEAFNGRNSDGVADVSLTFPVPSTVSSFSYFGNSGAAWLGKEIKQSTVKLTGLNPDASYDFAFFGSRKGVSDNRETLFIVKGFEEKSAAINTSANASSTALVGGNRPSEDGSLSIVITAGPNNNNGNGFFYFSAMQITRSE